MRSIDRKWTDLSLGWQAVQVLEKRLEAEFGRAVQAGHNIKFRRDLTEWQKKRRVFIAMAILAPLSLAGLCLAAFYFHEVSCVLAWWTMTVVVILGTLGVAGWSYIREMVSGRPAPERARVAVNLSERWWNSLAPAALEKVEPRKKLSIFLEQLDSSLSNSWICVGDLFAANPKSDRGILVLGPSGIWLFTARHWEGRITKSDGTWKQELKKGKVVAHDMAPDEMWVHQKEILAGAIDSHLPHLAWVTEGLQGGVVFSHPKAKLRKADICANTAPYGTTKAWLGRLHLTDGSKPDERLSLDVQLEILDQVTSLGRDESIQDKRYMSAKAEAERLYEEAASQLRAHIVKLVK